MSMICWLLGLSPSQIAFLRAETSLAGGLAKSAQDIGMKRRMDETMSRMPPERRQAYQAQRESMLANIPGAKEAEVQNASVRGRFEQIGPLEDAISLEKSWHMLHYLFTGHIDPWHAPGNALLTGDELGEDMGYGPVRLHNEGETAEFANFLETQDLARLQERLSYQEMSRIGVYAMPMGRGTEAEFEDMLRAEVASCFPLLRDYVVKMAGKQYGLLVWLS